MEASQRSGTGCCFGNDPARGVRLLWRREAFGTERCGKISLPHLGNSSALSLLDTKCFCELYLDKVKNALALVDDGQQVEAGATFRKEQIKRLLLNRGCYSHGKRLELG